MTTLFAEVAVVLPVMSTYHYRVPPELHSDIAVGNQILVPFGRRRLTGYVLSVTSQAPTGMATGVRDILQITSPEPYFTEAHLPFYRWLSSYYLAPAGEVINGVLPRGTGISTRRAAHISKIGLEALSRSKATPEEAEVLSLIRENPGLGLRQMRRHLPDIAVDQVCSKFSRRGWIIWHDEIQEPRIRPKYLRVVSLGTKVRDLAADELKPREREILALLADGPLLQRDLSRSVGNAYYWIRKMAATGLITVSTEEVYRDPGGQPIIELGSIPELTAQQDRTARAVVQALEQGGFASFLLHGVTGSGKTEVYLTAAAAAMRLHLQTLVLVPEIALTAQIEAVFRQRFQGRVAILHSALGQGERRDEWIRVRRGQADVVVGARSALFAPLERLGLIVVDEEHDDSYKQEKGCRYHGRDAAVMRAKLEEAVILMGSATPALSSYYNALQGKFRLLTLPDRIDERSLPEVKIVDMRKQRPADLISLPLRQALADNLAAGKQALLLINRRGYANFLLCRRCGYVADCRNCAVSLTWHRSGERLRCHLCGLALELPSRCPQCKAAAFKPYGFGTQKVETEVKRVFPEARVKRMDRDTTRSKRAHRQLLQDLGRGQTDILVGTQMIAKGHDFPNITLVGVVSADIALRWPEFRAAENTFQILTQVAGRAGRGEDPGTVLIQTYNPDHYSIRFAEQHDYVGFYNKEITFRKELGYPPYRRLILFQLRGNVEDKTQQAAQRLADRCGELLDQSKKAGPDIEMLGPVAAPLARIKGKYRYQLLLKALKSAPLLEVGRELMNRGQAELKGAGVSLIADVDPVSLI
jgi:primosomal protein N' (replication factor Y)